MHSAPYLLHDSHLSGCRDLDATVEVLWKRVGIREVIDVEGQA